MMKFRERGGTYHLDYVIDRMRRIRGTLGTKRRDVAINLVTRLEIAVSRGPESPLWPELSRVIPPRTFSRMAEHVGVREQYTLTCRDFLEIYVSHRKLEVNTGAIEINTLESYLRTIKEFERFLNERRIEKLRDIDVTVIDQFKVWRADRIRPIRQRTRSGDSTLRLEINHLHHMFKFAKDRGLIEKNPVLFMAVPWTSGKSEKKPYTGEEMLAMRQHAGDDQFLFVLLKCTGFRRSDVAGLLWNEVHFDRGVGGEIEHVCKKNGARVILPLLDELRCALEAEYRSRDPLPNEPVLLTEPKSPSLKASRGLFDDKVEVMSEPLSENELRRRERQIYRRIKLLGNRAGVADPHPHRFRHFFAVDSMVRGASTTYVASMMGDTEETVSSVYLPIVQELRDRLQFTLGSGTGLEELALAASQRRHIRKELPRNIQSNQYLLS